MKLEVTISRNELNEIVKRHVLQAVPSATVGSISFIIQTVGGGTFKDNEKIGVENAPMILRVEVDVARAVGVDHSASN